MIPSIQLLSSIIWFQSFDPFHGFISTLPVLPPLGAEHCSTFLAVFSLSLLPLRHRTLPGKYIVPRRWACVSYFLEIVHLYTIPLRITKCQFLFRSILYFDDLLTVMPHHQQNLAMLSILFTNNTLHLALKNFPFCGILLLLVFLRSAVFPALYVYGWPSPHRGLHRGFFSLW